MKRAMIILMTLFVYAGAAAQELFVATEPASNMAAGSMGFRLNSKFFKMENDGHYTYRLDPEIMVGVNKNWMVHLNMYASNMYQAQFRMEGAGVYAKYRFFSSDQVHSHFRMAAFGKISLINNPAELKTIQEQPGQEPVIKYYPTDEIDLDGNNSGWLGGIVATQLLHKLALSTTLSLQNRWNNLYSSKSPTQSSQSLNYSVSSGYLFLPFEYRDFRQTNMNLYCELLGAVALDKRANYLDLAPAIQFIFNSIARLDLSYRFQVAGEMDRLSNNYFLLRFEYNVLNLFKTGR